MKVTLEIPETIVNIVKAVVLRRASSEDDSRMIAQAVEYCKDNPQEISVESFGDNADNIGVSICLFVVANRIEQMEKEERNKCNN